MGAEQREKVPEKRLMQTDTVEFMLSGAMASSLTMSPSPSLAQPGSNKHQHAPGSYDFSIGRG
jgi:hypothetical protein